MPFKDYEFFHQSVFLLTTISLCCEVFCMCVLGKYVPDKRVFKCQMDVISWHCNYLHTQPGIIFSLVSACEMPISIVEQEGVDIMSLFTTGRVPVNIH